MKRERQRNRKRRTLTQRRDDMFDAVGFLQLFHIVGQHLHFRFAALLLLYKMLYKSEISAFGVFICTAYTYYIMLKTLLHKPIVKNQCAEAEWRLPLSL